MTVPSFFADVNRQFSADTCCTLLHIRQSVPADGLRPVSFHERYSFSVVTDRQEEISFLEP
jgi:hypothetical protein